MNSFTKYFIYFMSICVGLTILIVLVQSLIYKESFKIGFLLVLLCAAFIYSLGMAVLFSSASNPSLVKISDAVANDGRLEEFFATKKRYPVECNSTRKVYRAKNKVSVWVSNDIVVYKDGGMWFVSMPNVYVNEFKNKFQIN